MVLFLHYFAIAKLAAYDLDYESLVFMLSYPSERQQRIKIHNAYRTYSDKIRWCSTRGNSIQGQLFFNTFINDTFYDINKCDILSYADDNTPYNSDFNREEVIQKPQLITNNLFQWLKNNHMKANADKCHLLVARDTDVTAKSGDFDVKNSREENFLMSK